MVAPAECATAFEAVIVTPPVPTKTCPASTPLLLTVSIVPSPLICGVKEFEPPKYISSLSILIKALLIS